MKHIKIFEQHKLNNRDKIFITAFENALKNGNEQFINDIKSKGFPVEKYYAHFKEYCVDNDCLKSLKYVIPREKYDKYFTEEGEIKDWDIFRASQDGDPDLKYEFGNMLISIDKDLYENDKNQLVPSIDYTYDGYDSEDPNSNDESSDGSFLIYLDSSHPNANVDSNSGIYYIQGDNDSYTNKMDKIIKSFMKSEYPHLKNAD